MWRESALRRHGAMRCEELERAEPAPSSQLPTCLSAPFRSCRCVRTRPQDLMGWEQAALKAPQHRADAGHRPHVALERSLCASLPGLRFWSTFLLFSSVASCGHLTCLQLHGQHGRLSSSSRVPLNMLPGLFVWLVFPINCHSLET